MGEINIVVCLCCGEVLHSKHRHDFVQCKCPNEAFTDGGTDYHRMGAMDLKKVHRCITPAEARRVSFLVHEKL